MTNNDLISVIVPCFNAGSYLEQCLVSIRKQTHSNIEILVVNDGSTDDSEIISLQQQALDSRIRYLYSENQGVSNARNIGIEAAKGSFLSFIDADDVVEPIFLEALLSCCKDHKVLIAEIFYRKQNRQANYKMSRIFCPEKIQVQSMTKHFHKLFQFQGAKLINKLYARELFQKLRFPLDQKFGEDSFVACQAMLACDQIAIYPEILYYYINTDSSAMHQKYTLRRLQELSTFDKLYACLPNQNKSVFRQYLLEEHQRMLAGHFRLLKKKMPEAKAQQAELKEKSRWIFDELKKIYQHHLFKNIHSLLWYHFPCRCILFYYKSHTFMDNLFFLSKKGY